MGLYNLDDKSLYRLNVQEIPWNKLQGVPSNEAGNPTAINQGTVQVRCFIHPYCPFVKVPREEYDLAFNELTLPVINDVLPDEAKNAFTTTHGVEGMHFSERYVYRHNYLVEANDSIQGPTPSGAALEDYKPIAIPNIPSVNNTRYQEEQTWIIRESVFDEAVVDKVNLNSSSTYFQQRCQGSASWTYTYPTLTSDYTDIDELLDYKSQYYRANSKVADEDNAGIDVTRVQMPRQASATDCFGGGAHWRVEKKTSLFRGEDFFVELRRFAKSTTSTNADKQAKVNFSSSYPQYKPLDVYASDSKVIPFASGAPAAEIYVNNAVRQSDNEDERTAWRLIDQAYYVIELGDATNGTKETSEHYFLIITERAYPIFVMIDDVEGFSYSKILGTYNNDVGGVHGKSIINSESARITFRNHLGKLIIYFDLDGDRKTPWVITKNDYNVINDLQANLASSGANIETKEPVSLPITVPKGPLQIWGGNLSCGFVFGPLQYSKTDIRFRWPQKHSLPMNTRISARLTASDEFIHDMARYQDIPGSPSKVVPLFTQGAHFYKQWGRSSQFRGIAKWKKGSFFFGNIHDPLIELSPTGSPGVRDASIELLDWNGTEDDEDRRRVKFYLEVLLESGSHLFNGERNPRDIGWREKSPYITPTANNLSDSSWVVTSCKTPILTGLRLVAEENSNPRWPDGSPNGYGGLPSAEGPYFRDVSHHVMSYTEDWTANDFYELEHSGTIQFLLKEINVKDNDGETIYTFDDSLYLTELQDKNFFIEIWAGYVPLKNGLEYTQMGGFYKLMTGMCHGGSLDKTASRVVMTCQIKDYKEVLKDQKFFNSPFFDGMRDVNAVAEILSMAGFRSKGEFDPGRYLLTLKEEDFSGQLFFPTGDGRFFISNPYALPSSYRRIDQAYFKFDAGTTYYDAIVKIAQTGAKLFYFDQHGMAHLESYMDLIMQNLQGGNVLFDLFTFTSNPYGPSMVNQTGITYPGQLIYNKVEWQYRQEDVHNHLKVISSTPNQDLLVADDVRWESVDYPDVNGFVGYKKLFYQKEGMLGSEGAVKNLIDFYRVMFLPELFVRFETHGLPMRATDFISVDGQFFRASKVSHEINAEKNRWWMNVEGERMQFIQ